MRRIALILVLALTGAALFAAAEAAPGAAPGSVVAVLDTGVSAAPPLAGRLLPGIDLVDGDNRAADPNGHGTAVASAVIAACPGCTILPVRVLSADGVAPWTRVAAGIVWAVDRGARIVNVSIAGPTGSPALRRAVAYAVSKDVLVVAAAGNTGTAEPQFPAAYPGVLAVGAAGSDWSARGGWIDVALPGCARLPVAGTLEWACGTSFATPRAAGLVARGIAPASVSGAAPAATVRSSGTAAPGRTVRASATHGSVRWFRCAPGAAAHGCTAVSRGSAYRVTAADTGSTLVARALTRPFGGLWLASSRPLAVAAG